MTCLHAKKFGVHVPHNELPDPPGTDQIETRAVLKAALLANTAPGRETLRYRTAPRTGSTATINRGLTTNTASAGRTGRILNILLLVEAGLLHQPLLYLSRYIIETKNDYYRLLREVTERGAWEEWVLCMLDGVRQTSIS